jgi:hypothetical protein
MNECFQKVHQRLIDAVLTKQLRDSEFRSGSLFLNLAANSNGYLNCSHEEAMMICGTTKNSTMRGHLVRLRNAGIIARYNTNGSVRVKFAGRLYQYERC